MKSKYDITFPFWFFYIPILPYYLYLSLRRKSLAFFTNVNNNNTFHMGGFVNSSKAKILNTIDKKYLPKTIYGTSKSTLAFLKASMVEHQINYPIILKPDKGERGKGIIKISGDTDLFTYINQNTYDFVIQEFIGSPLEFGILYYKHPSSGSGHISSICLKEIPFIVGDGTSSIKELINNKYSLDTFSNLDNSDLESVLKNQEKFKLDYVAHRSRNSIFRDYNHLNCDQLLNTFNTISKNIRGFHFGRYDVKVNSIDDLINGIDLKILELNGVNSQPIHIFDPNHSFYKRYKDLHRHWKIIYDISYHNHIKGTLACSTKSLIKEIILNSKS